MKKQKYYIAAGALLCASALSVFSSTLDTYAFENSVDGSSYFDSNAQACIVENYNAENSTSITSIEDIDPTKITTLDCSGRDISNFKGVTILTNLKTLNVSNNPRLVTYGSNFLTPASLETINVSNTNTFFDFSHSPSLETITTDRTLYLTTIAYAEKTEDYGDDEYAIDLSELKFLDSSSAHAVSFRTKNDVPGSVSITSGGYTHQVSTRGGWASYAIYLNGNTEVETHNPIYINNNCEEDSEGYYNCNNAVYYGDIIDTDAITEDILSKVFNLSGYTLSKVEIIPPTANIKLTTNEDAVKKGMVLADANFTLKFYFDLGDLGTPDTGAFTTGSTTVVASTAAVAVVAISVVAYLSRHVTKRQKAKVHFGRE